jgi:hypothetical protein
MRLYAGTTREFVADATRNTIARRLENAFLSYFRYRPSPGEVRSWEESLSRLSMIVSSAHLDDHGVFLEYQLPQTSRRLDAMLTGLDDDRRANAVIVELKQWQKTEECDADGMVSTWLGGNVRDTLHPSLQANQYRAYLADMHTAFYEGEPPISLSACAYLHNYWPADEDPIFAVKFDEVRTQAPIFSAGDSSDLEDFLVSRLRAGCGVPILERIEKSKMRPSKKLLDHVAAVVQGEPRFVLLDEQQIVFRRVLTEAKHGWADGKKRVLLVQGGPGTGKSVLAANLLGHLSKEGLNAQYATGSRAFTETMRRIVGARASAQFTYFNSYVDAELNSTDVLICDEAHRIRKDSSSRFTPKADRESMRQQIDELLRAAKVAVFFIDDLQIVRPGEMGSADLIRNKAREQGSELREYRLDAQFRCAGSDAFVNWIDNTLGVARTATQVWNQKEESFELKVFSSAKTLDAAIRQRVSEDNSARLVAGFCWPWSNPKSDGSLVDDVVIGDFLRPWNARPEAKRLAKNVPKATLWAHDARGVDQVGCVYTAQGFEFDYVGVIWGADLRFDPVTQDWVADTVHSHDSTVKRSKVGFREFIKNTYRVLLSRGLKGCYIYCVDPETAKFLLSRTEGVVLDAPLADLIVQSTPISSATESANGTRSPAQVIPLRVVPPDKQRPFQNCIPVIDLKAAAGGFGEFQMPSSDAILWVEPPPKISPSMDLFVAQVIGESMNRQIPNGAWCLFRLNPGGTRNGKIVLAQLRDYSDPDSGASFTVKRYESTKAASDDGGQANILIRLRPESLLEGYHPIEIAPDEEHIRVLAEFLRVL